MCSFILHFFVRDWSAEDKAGPEKDNIITSRPWAAGTQELVLELVKAVKLQWDHPYVVVTDSGFTMAKTARSLLELSCHSLGAFKVPFGGIPAQITMGNSNANKKLVGKMTCARSVDSVLGVQNWVDRGVVHVLSTYHTLANGTPGYYIGSDIRKTMRNRKDTSMSWADREVEIPGACMDYSKYMSGVDKNDRLRAEFNTQRECKRWYMCIFYFVLDASIAQTAILFRMQSPDHHKVPMLSLRVELVEGLLAAAQALEPHPERPLGDADEVIETPAAAKRPRVLMRTLVNHTAQMQWLPPKTPGSSQLYCDSCFNQPGAHRFEADVTCLACGGRFCYNRKRQCYDQHNFYYRAQVAEV